MIDKIIGRPFKKGNKTWTTGKHRTEEDKNKIRHSLKGKYLGENSKVWKGDKVGYSGLHYWVMRWKGKPDTCEHCGKSGLKGRQIGWANIDHKYRRVLEDYIRLCAECHKIYDIQNNNYFKNKQKCH